MNHFFEIFYLTVSKAHDLKADFYIYLATIKAVRSKPALRCFKTDL